MLQRTNIYLQTETISLLKRKAQEERITMSEIIRQAVAKEIEKERGNAAKSLLELSKKAGSSGIGDLSRRHDYYLYIEPYEKKQKKRKQKK